MNLQALWHSPRVWTMLSALLTRGVGFIASFSLAREAGAEALSLYIALVITAASVVAPFAQVFLNASTMAAARAKTRSWLSQFVLRNLLLGLVLAVPLLVVFAYLHWHVAASSAVQLRVPLMWLGVVGISVVLAPLWQAVLTGAMNGSGWQTSCAKVTALTAAVVLPFSYPAAHIAGVKGAWVVLLLSVWLPPLVLWLLWLRCRQQAATDLQTSIHQNLSTPWRQSWLYFRDGLPNAGALLLGGMVTWWCSVHLPQKVWGAQGVAVLSINNQWLALILLPATSWGSVALAEMARAHAADVSAPQAWALVRRWLMRNVLVTGAVALCVIAVVPFLEKAYRIEGQSFRALLFVSAAAAMLSAAYAVFERALICWGRQHYLLLIAGLAAFAQVVMTQVMVEQSLLYVQWAVLVGACLMLGCGSFGFQLVLKKARE
jgi:hypothetical protein